MRRIATIGFFDGVHLGHQTLFATLQQEADKRNLETVIFTFREHPKTVLTNVSTPLLTTLDERYEKLAEYGTVCMQDFRSIHHETAEQYLRYLHEHEDVNYVMMGYDQRFGSDGVCDFSDYVAIGQKAGIEIVHCQEYMINGQHISSSRIRRLLETGSVEDANALLGYDYCLTGVVEHGNGIGRQIGVPTANLCVANEKLLPSVGVYVGCIDSLEKRHLVPVLVNIGTNPTIGNTTITVEVHIPNFDGDLYNQEITVSLKRYLRPEQRFSSLESLRAQIASDIKSIIL